MSKHLAILKQKGLLVEQQRGKRTFCALPKEFASPVVGAIVRAAMEGLKSNAELVEDQRLAKFMREFRIETVEAALNAREKRSVLRGL